LGRATGLQCSERGREREALVRNASPCPKPRALRALLALGHRGP
jgi:hypothetical protein